MTTILQNARLWAAALVVTVAAMFAVMGATAPPAEASAANYTYWFSSCIVAGSDYYWQYYSGYGWYWYYC